MVEYMITLLLFGLLCLYIFYYICKKEYYEDFVPKQKEQPYTETIALKSLEVFITTLNKDTKDSFNIYNVENIKRITNKLYIKCFVQHSIKKYVRLYFAELQLPFQSKSDPILSYYGEYGNGKKIENGSYNLKDSANYAKYNGFMYSLENRQQNNIFEHEHNNNTINSVQNIYTANLKQNINTTNSKQNINTINNKQNIFLLIYQMILSFIYKLLKYFL